MNDRIADTRQCPYCRAWIAMPPRRQREAFNAHRAECAMREGYGTRDAHPEPAFNPNCGRCGADIAADPFHACATMCDCGRGPILQGNGTPDVCATCYMAETATVKRASLFDGVIDTYQTETELNGHRATQGALL